MPSGQGPAPLVPRCRDLRPGGSAVPAAASARPAGGRGLTVEVTVQVAPAATSLGGVTDQTLGLADRAGYCVDLGADQLVWRARSTPSRTLGSVTSIVMTRWHPASGYKPAR